MTSTHGSILQRKESKQSITITKEQLQADIQEKNGSLIHALLEVAEEMQLNENKTEANQLAKALVSVMFRFKCDNSILLKVFNHDLESVIDSKTAFREQNVSLLCLRAIFTLLSGDMCVRYLLHSQITPLIESEETNDTEMVLACVSNIMDRCKRKAAVLLPGGREKLHTVGKTSTAGGRKKEIWRTFALIFGPLLAVLQHSLHNILQIEKNNYELITSLFFLRFITPALATPKETGLLKRQPAASQLKKLRLVARLLQCVANGTSPTNLGLNKSEQFLETFVQIQRKGAIQFVDALIQLPVHTAQLPGLHMNEALRILSQYEKETIQLQLAWKPTLKYIGNRYNCQQLLTDIRVHQKKTYGFILAPLEPHACIPLLFGLSWSAQFEIAAVSNRIEPVNKELIQAAVSVINKCQLCVDLHTTAAMGMGLSFNSIHNLTHGKELPKNTQVTQQMQDLVAWARISNSQGHYLLVNPPFTAEEAPEICGSAFLKHYFNRITNTFLKEFTRVKGNIFKSKVFEKKSESVAKAAATKKHPGKSLRFAFASALASHTDLATLETNYPTCCQPTISNTAMVAPQFDEYDCYQQAIENDEYSASEASIIKTGGWHSQLDGDFKWATANSTIAEIMCRWHLFEEHLAQESLPPKVIEKLNIAVGIWDGVCKFNALQMDNFLADLNSTEAVMAKLVISIAQDPSKVSSRLTKQFVNLFQDVSAEEASSCLIAACSYAAFIAAKRISSFWNNGLSSHDATNSCEDDNTKTMDEIFNGTKQYSSNDSISSQSNIVQFINCNSAAPPFEVINTTNAIVIRICTLTAATRARIEGPYIDVNQNKTQKKDVNKFYYTVTLCYPTSGNNTVYTTMPQGEIDLRINLPCATFGHLIKPLSVADIQHERNGGILELTFPFQHEPIVDTLEL